MKTAAIIAEFNPFHRGHAYLLERAREAGADRVLVVMSGDFVQRGAPALVNKYVRAEMAVRGGADLVLCLPVRCATASAEAYADAHIRALMGLGCADLLVFGSECGDLGRLRACAEVLAFEPESYRERLRAGLARGSSFPRARAEALPEFADLLAEPNNILGVEYLKSMIRRKAAFEALTVKRQGAGYHNTDLEDRKTSCGDQASSPEDTEELFASATAIRKALAGIYDAGFPSASSGLDEKVYGAASRQEEIRRWMPAENRQEGIRNRIPAENRQEGIRNRMPAENRQEGIRNWIPTEAASVLKEELTAYGPADEDLLKELLAAALFASDEPAYFAAFADVDEELARRIPAMRADYQGVRMFAETISSKNRTVSHAMRALLHIALGIRKDSPGMHADRGQADSSARIRLSGGDALALQLLAVKSGSEDLLAQIRRDSTVPLVIRGRSDLIRLNSAQRALIEEEYRVSNLYEMLVSLRSGRSFRNEYERYVLRV